jgi:hypothetical protein
MIAPMTLFWRQTALFDPSVPAKGAFSRAQIIVNAAKYLRLWTETSLVPFGQAHASTAAVLWNKLYTSSFECFTHGNEVVAVWDTQSSFEIHNRSARNTCSFCQLGLAPAEHRSGTSALLHGNWAHQLKSVFLFDFGAKCQLK